MDYISPYGANPGDPYVDDNEALEVDGSIPPAQFFNDLQAEVLNLLTAAGIVPAAGDLTQVAQAIQKMIIAGGKTVKDTDAAFEATVADGNPVRWDAVAGEYVKALADGTAANHAVGFADVTNAEVIFFGMTRVGLFAGLTPGARQYLSGAVAGEMVEVAPDDPVRLGIAVSATQMFVDVDTGDAPATIDAMPLIFGWEQGVGNLDLEVAEYFSFIPPACRLTAALGGGVGVIGEASAGAAVEVDVLKNGVSVFSARPSWAATTGTLTPGTLTGTITFNGTTDVLSAEIAAIGSTAAGRKLLYTLFAERI